MSRVEVVTKEGKTLGMIDDDNKSVEMTEEWKKRWKESRKKKKEIKEEEKTDG